MTDESSICYWRCPNCGQLQFGDTPPDMCAFCRDFTTWQLVAGTLPLADSIPPLHPKPDNGLGSPEGEDRPPKPPNRAHQRRLFD
ncbi:MAG TPA: hypothetical protein VHL11_01830 [Phototrophicaceae bacterium]|nr:hypothetical protein [Phototrophicaceae bacterium]